MGGLYLHVGSAKSMIAVQMPFLWSVHAPRLSRKPSEQTLLKTNVPKLREASLGEAPRDYNVYNLH